MNKLQDLRDNGSVGYRTAKVVLACTGGFLFGAAIVALFLFGV